MIVAPLLLSCLALAGAQHGAGWPSLNGWAASYPEISSPRISQFYFQDNKEYRYLYDGQILTGLPETANQYSGLRIRALFTVQLRSGVDVFQIERVSLGKVNSQIIRGPLALQPVDLFEELQGEEAAEWEAALTMPIRFEYNQGLITDMESLDSDPFWSVNIKRSILATFNLNLKNQAGSNAPFNGRIQNAENLDNSQYFTIMEEGIGGECEAVYLVQSIPTGSWGAAPVSGSLSSPAGVLNVTKSWDYTNCRSRPISIESLSNAVQCPKVPGAQCGGADNQKNRIIDSSAQTRYNIIGNPSQYVIETASTEGVHKFTPYSDEAGSLTAYINATIRLIGSGEWTRDRLTTERGNQLKGLRQLFPSWNQNEYLSEHAEKPLRGQMGQWPNVAAKKALVTSLLTRLVEDLADDEVAPESADLVFQMSLVLQYATMEELAEIHREVKQLTHQSVEQQQIQKLWMDILALTGTKPAVLFIQQEIMTGSLHGERAAQTVNTLAFSIRKPDSDVVDVVHQLCSSPAVQATEGLKKACWLSFGTLLHTACVGDVQTVNNVQNVLVQNGNPECSVKTQQQYLVALLGRLKAAQTEDEQILMIQTLGNTGLPGMANDLKFIFSDDSKPILVRVQAIYALLHVARSHPERVMQLLVPEYHDLTNHFQVRIAAFDVIIAARPDRPELQAIARSLHKEQSVQVGSYVWSKLTTLANSTHPCFEQLAADASLALEFGKPFHTGYSFSKGLHAGGFSDKLQMGAFVELNTVGEPSSIIPRSANIRVNGHALGLSQDIVEVGFDTEGLHSVSALLKNLVLSPRSSANQNTASLAELFASYENDDVSTPFRKPFNNRPELDEIDRLLGLNDKAAEESKGSAYIKIFGQRVRVLNLSPRSIKKTIRESLNPSELAQLMGGQKTIDFRKALMVADSRLMIPTELGIPLTVELKAPVVVSVKGTVGLKQQSGSLALESDIKVSVASHVVAEMNIESGFVKLGAGMMTKLSLTVPLRGAVSVDLKSGKVASTIRLPEEPLELLNIQMMPMTFTKLIPKTLVAHQPDRKSQQTVDRSAKIVEFNRQPLANEQPNQYFSLKTDLVENPFMLSANQYQYQGLPVPVIEVKEVPTEDALRTKSIDMVLGHPALGGVLKVKGHVQLPYGVPVAPMVPIGGKTRVVVTLQPASSGLKTVEAALHIRRQHFAGSANPDWNTLFDQMTGAQSTVLARRLASGLPATFSNDDKSGYSAQLVFQGRTGNNQEIAMQGVFSLVRGLDGKYVKVAASLQSPHQQTPFEACIDGQAQYPSEYNAQEITAGMNHPITGQLELAFGRSCNAPDAMKVQIKVLGDKSPKQMALEKNDYYSVQGSVIPTLTTKSADPVVQMLKPVYKQCESDRKQGMKWSDACETVRELYSSLMQVKIDVDYQNIPLELEDLLEKVERLTHSAFYWNSEVNSARVQNAPNKISILADFTDGADRVNVVYSTPRKDVKLINMPVPYPLGPLSAEQKPLNLWEALLQENLENVCSVSGNKLKTLDSSEMSLPYSECYHLLAKDCSRDEMWSVLFASAGVRNGDAKKVKVLIGDRKIELIPAELITSRFRSMSDIVVRVDGRPIQLGRENQEVDVDQDISIVVRKNPGQETPTIVLKAEELGLELMFDGQNIAVKPSFLLRSQICGLCGNDNEEQWDDMLLPNGKPASNVEELVRGYTVQQDNCATELRPYEREQLRTGQSGDCKLRTIVKYQPGEICFSVQPVAVSELELDDQQDFVHAQRVGFHCLPQESSAAQRLEREAQVRIVQEVANKPVTDMFLVTEARSCGAQAGLGQQRNSFAFRAAPEWF